MLTVPNLEAKPFPQLSFVGQRGDLNPGPVTLYPGVSPRGECLVAHKNDSSLTSNTKCGKHGLSWMSSDLLSELSGRAGVGCKAERAAVSAWQPSTTLLT